MRRVSVGTITLVLTSCVAMPLSAQDRPETPPTSAPDTERPTREQIRQRFAGRVKTELKLTDEQASRLQTTAETFAKQRQGLRARERELRRALADQLRPGIAAKDDSVARLTDDLLDLRFRYVETFRNEMKDVSRYLTPVQRAQLLIMRERLYRTVERFRGERGRGRAGWDRSPGR